jgi:hypothetical protein
MTPEETGTLLAICASYDRRTVGDTDILAWYRILGALKYDDCEAAVLAHYTATREWIMPSDVITGALGRRAAERPHSNACRDGDHKDCRVSWCECACHPASARALAQPPQPQHPAIAAPQEPQRGLTGPTAEYLKAKAEMEARQRTRDAELGDEGRQA